MKNDGLQNQAVLYVMDTLDGQPRPILDPNTWSNDGTVALGGLGFSKDGRYMAYCRAEAGSDWLIWHVMEIASEKTLPDELRWTKSAQASWTKDGQGFFYSRFEEPKKGAEFQSLNFNSKLFYHRLGDPQSADNLTYYRPEHPEWEYVGTVTEDGHWLVVTTQFGTDERNRVTIIDLAKPDAKPFELIDDFEHEYAFVGNAGSIFYFKTDLGRPAAATRGHRPRGRQRRAGRHPAGQISNRPTASIRHWKEIIPQAEPTLIQVGFVGDRFIASYLEDVKPKARVFERDGRFAARRAISGHRRGGRFRRRADRHRNLLCFLQLRHAIEHLPLRHGDAAKAACSAGRS